MKGGYHISVWLPHEEGQPDPAPTVGGEGTLRFVCRVSIVGQMGSGTGTADAELLRYHCFLSVMVPGERSKGCACYLSCWIVARPCPNDCGSYRKISRMFKWRFRTSRLGQTSGARCFFNIRTC